ncbi:Hyphally regulated cell wall protein N-terminal family protein [Candida parapsilosis]|uniref:Hyphally regulated cell wall protein N-terminal family protein n=1 Tax=Candida parapsilosis TaxID=5480 RepID=A0A8X7NL69_CANPA|nr:Hyphally regulated cell wall protein N-terminal family protein [Candida parapsilosis]KAF6051206.1 Hyphally regulated cell wall protein N-terminal family protein [Candida parapsilosis]
MQLLLNAQVVVWLFIATAWGRELQGGFIVDWGSQNVGNGDVSLYSKSIWSIINNAATDFHGNIKVDATSGLYVSTVSPQVSLSATLYDSIYSFVNDGIVSFNAIRGAPGYIFRIMGDKFLNNGDLYFAASGVGSAESAIKGSDWHNNGLIHIYQQMKSDSYTYLGYDGKTMVNNGQICFTNQNWKQLTGMLGSGCVTAQEKASFYFMNTDLQISEGEIFYLSGGETSIMAVGSINRPQTFHVRGFGTYNGMANKIGLTATLSSPASGKAPWAYDAEKGILTLYVGSYSQNFEIGTGYDIPSSGLSVTPVEDYQCKPCKAVPGIPGVDKPPATTYEIDTATIKPSDVPNKSTVAPYTSSKASHGLVKTVTVFSTDIVMATSTFTITSTVTP